MSLSPTQWEILRALGEGAELHWRDGQQSKPVAYLVLERGTRVVRADTLATLLRRGLVEEVEQADGAFRRYAVTDAGRRAVQSG
jgi:hypothetical protein